MSPTWFINDPAPFVADDLRATTLANPGVGLDKINNIVYARANYASSTRQRLSLVSGGSSEYETSFGAMVGPGLLSAAVMGTISASPSVRQVRAAILSQTDHNELDDMTGAEDRGTLVVVASETDDVLNFGVAVEMARAAGAKVEMVVVGNDVAVHGTRAGKAGSRGLAGTVLVHKIAGALAFKGYGLVDTAAAARRLVENLVSIGTTLGQVRSPGLRVKKPLGKETPQRGEIGVGMSIHNEEGWNRERLNVDGLIGNMLAHLLKQGDQGRCPVDFSSGDVPVVLLVNNLGGLSVMELGAITSAISFQLGKEYDIHPVRIYSGTYMTSLNTKGFSITLLRAVDLGLEDTDVLRLLDYPVEAPGWTSNLHISRSIWGTGLVNR